MTIEERMVKLEIRLDKADEDIKRFRDHISSLLTFMNRIYGALVVISFLGLGNLLMLLRAITRH